MGESWSAVMAADYSVSDGLHQCQRYHASRIDRMFDLSNMMLGVGMPVPLDHRSVTDFCKVASQRRARVRRKLNEDAPPVVRIGAANEDPLADHCLEPSQRRRRWHRGGNAKTGDGNAQMRDLGLEQIEQHVPRRIGEQ